MDLDANALKGFIDMMSEAILIQQIQMVTAMTIRGTFPTLESKLMYEQMCRTVKEHARVDEMSIQEYIQAKNDKLQSGGDSGESSQGVP